MLPLSDNWTRLAHLAKRVGYGCIYEIEIRDGEPALDNPLQVEYSRLLRPNRPANTKRDAHGPETKVQFQNLVDLCGAEGDLIITELQIQDGLPHQVKYRKEEMA